MISRFKDFFRLLKPGVMSLAVYTALVGIVMAPGSIGIFEALVSIFAIAIGAGASAALNMYYDADIDRIMVRTASRPIPMGRISPSEVLVFGLFLSVLAISILGMISNWVSAGLLSLSIFFYAVVYTVWLKRRTPQNIVIGGIAGALPPMIGWSVVTGEVSIDSFVMFLIIFLWTPPHFWSLALLNKDDYAKAGIPMLPNVVTERVTKINILAYTVLTAIAGVLPAILGFVSMAYGLIASLLGCKFILGALRIAFSCGGEKIFVPARKLFLFSITYLFALFTALMFDYLIGMTVILNMFLTPIKDGLF